MSNPMLRWYESEFLDQIPARITLDPLYESAADLTLRDSAGGWWRPQRDGSWIHHDGTWKLADRPDSLEGVTPLPIDLAPPPVPLAEPDAAHSSAGPVADLERSIENVCALYRSGRMVSTMAELALSDRKVIGDDGSLWTSGAQSRTWYRYEDEAWDPSPTRPERPFLAGEDAIAAAEAEGSALQAWAEKGPLLPEAITGQWDPPVPPGSLVEQSVEAGRVVPEPPPPAAASIWQPSHHVPEGGMQAWAQPDPSTAVVAELHTGTELTCVSAVADWAKVRAENGWEGWVDGRRLLQRAPSMPPHDPQVPQDARPQDDDTGSDGRDPWLIGAAAALLLAAFLPWQSSYSFDETSALSAPVAFFWDYFADESWFSVGIIVLLLGVAAVTSLFVDKVRPYRRSIGWIGVALSALFIVQMLRFINDWNEDLVHSLTDLFSIEFAIGPWIALFAAGVLARKP